MIHIHNVQDNDSHFLINEVTRDITNVAPQKTILVQGDHNSERFTFEVPRYVEGHDLSLSTKVEIHYINVAANGKEQSEDVYLVDDLGISPDDENMVILSWLISGNATKYAGTLHFLIRFVCLTDDTIDYAWNTAIYEGITVGKGMNNGESVVSVYTDVLEAWKREVLGEVNADDVPTEGSTNLVKSGGIYEWSTQMANDIASQHAQGVVQNADFEPIEGSTNLVQSGGVWEDINSAYGFAVETVNSLRLAFNTETNILSLYKDGDEQAFAEIEIPLDGKLDKVTGSGARVYFVEGSTQKTQPMIYNKATAWSVAQRTGDGQLFVGAPTDNGHATTKEYVDAQIAALRAELTS